jgi:hypothetical protein
MNVIGSLCDRLTRFQAVMNSREQSDPEAMIKRLIASCDTAMTDLRVSLVDRLKEKVGNRQTVSRPNYANQKA